MDGIGDSGEPVDHVNGFGAFVKQFLLAAPIRLEADPDGEVVLPGPRQSGRYARCPRLRASTQDAAGADPLGLYFDAFAVSRPPPQIQSRIVGY